MAALQEQNETLLGVVEELKDALAETQRTEPPAPSKGGRKRKEE